MAVFVERRFLFPAFLLFQSLVPDAEDETFKKCQTGHGNGQLQQAQPQAHGAQSQTQDAQHTAVGQVSVDILFVHTVW